MNLVFVFIIPQPPVKLDPSKQKLSLWLLNLFKKSWINILIMIKFVLTKFSITSFLFEVRWILFIPKRGKHLTKALYKNRRNLVWKGINCGNQKFIRAKFSKLWWIFVLYKTHAKNTHKKFINDECQWIKLMKLSLGMQALTKQFVSSEQ